MTDAKLYLGSTLIGGGGDIGEAMARSLDSDWCAYSDTKGVTGAVLGDLIGPAFDPYRGMATIADVAGDASAKAVVSGSSPTLALIRRTTAAAARYFLPAIGDPLLDGYYVGIMDSTQAGAIPANDQSQTGKRYAMVSLDAAVQPAGGTIQYKTSGDAAPLACQTVWDGLAATQAMIVAGAAYPAAQFAAGVSVLANGASVPYIPAMRELLAMYWVFKPMTANNYLTADTTSTFPGGTVTQGLNPSSDPTRPAFTATVPGQTTLAAWKTGGAQAFINDYYRTSSEAGAATAWSINFDTSPGRLAPTSKTAYVHLRLIRRFAV